ncbi:MAG: hypothetical protein IPI60_16160 [Saprospiraceae bacterium]|nr:hypothetical protein [Saprospiraceae bacterium]
MLQNWYQRNSQTSSFRVKLKVISVVNFVIYTKGTYMIPPENKSEKKLFIQKDDKTLPNPELKNELKPIQLLLVKELEDIERKLRENLNSDDKKEIS